MSADLADVEMMIKFLPLAIDAVDVDHAALNSAASSKIERISSSLCSFADLVAGGFKAYGHVSSPTSIAWEMAMRTGAERIAETLRRRSFPDLEVEGGSSLGEAESVETSQPRESKGKIGSGEIRVSVVAVEVEEMDLED